MANFLEYIKKEIFTWGKGLWIYNWNLFTSSPVIGVKAFFVRLKAILDHFGRVKPFFKPLTPFKAISLLKPFLDFLFWFCLNSSMKNIFKGKKFFFNILNCQLYLPDLWPQNFFCKTNFRGKVKDSQRVKISYLAFSFIQS